MKQIAQVITLAIIFALSPFSSTYASEVGSLHTFVNGTTAQASQVNDNFSAVETAVNDNAANIATNAAALPMMWASTDTVLGGVIRPAGYGAYEVNSVSISVPSNGYLIISGNILINNEGVADSFHLSPDIDGSYAVAAEFAAASEAQADGTYGEMITLAYTVTVAITSGTHTVSQSIEAYYYDDAFFYNANHMTVLFMPASQGTVIPTSNAQTMGDIESKSPDGTK